MCGSKWTEGARFVSGCSCNNTLNDYVYRPLGQGDIPLAKWWACMSATRFYGSKSAMVTCALPHLVCIRCFDCYVVEGLEGRGIFTGSLTPFLVPRASLVVHMQRFEYFFFCRKVREALYFALFSEQLGPVLLRLCLWLRRLFSTLCFLFFFHTIKLLKWTPKTHCIFGKSCVFRHTGCNKCRPV